METDVKKLKKAIDNASSKSKNTIKSYLNKLTFYHHLECVYFQFLASAGLLKMNLLST